MNLDFVITTKFLSLFYYSKDHGQNPSPHKCSYSSCPRSAIPRKIKGGFILITKEIENKIKQLSADYIYHNAVSNLLLLLMNAVDNEPEEDIATYALPKDILKIQEAIKNYTLELEEILDSNSQRRMAALEDCLVLKDSILSIFKSFYGYITLWNLYAANISDKIMLLKYGEEVKDNDGLGLDWDTFYRDCYAFLESIENPTVKKEYFSQILNCIPIKMVRSKYFDIVAKTLSVNLKELPTEAIEKYLQNIKILCTPELATDFGKYFPEISQWFQEKQKLQLDTLSQDELQHLHEEFHSMLDYLMYVIELLHSMSNDIQSFIILFHLTYTLDELTADDVAYADYYHTVCDILSGEISQDDQLAYSDTLCDSLESAIETILDKANDLNKKELSYLKKATSFENFSEDTKKILSTEEFVRNCFFHMLENSLYEFTSDTPLPKATKKEMDEKITEFSAEVSAYLQELPVSIKRVTMQNLFSTLSPYDTAEDIITLLKDAIEASSSVTHKIIIMDKILSLLDSEEYDPFFNEEINTLHHEHHCDCGHEHEHHHEHHCDCGHEHEHHHHH